MDIGHWEVTRNVVGRGPVTVNKKAPPETEEQYFVLYRSCLLQPFLIRNGQFLTALLATASQNLAAIGSFHTLAETMDSLTTFTMRLECTFHVLIFSRLQN